jgi:hypothetical protein
MRPPPRSGPPTIVIVLLVLLGLPALFVGGCFVCVASHAPKPAPAPTQAEREKNCARIVVELGTYKGSSLPYDEAMTELRGLKTKADAGIADCKAAGMLDAVAALEDVKRQLERQQVAAQEADRAARLAQRKDDDNKKLDPANCAKGKVLIDPATGKMVSCTGAAAGTSAGGDDDDVRAICKGVKDAWMRSDGIAPVIDCTGEGPNHRDVKVVVTGAGWDYLGDHGKRRAFAQSIVDAYRPHWKSFHGWRGEEPAEKQVHVMKMNGLDLGIAATISASGFYVDGEAVVP